MTEEATEEATEEEELAGGRPFQLIVLDDDPDIAQLLERALAGAGCEVRRFGNPTQALTEVDRDPPDLILTDLNMPGMNGLEFIRRVKRAHPHIELILITGFGSKEVAIEALRLGVSDFLEKPLDIARVRVLVTEIQSQVMHQRQEDEAEEEEEEPVQPKAEESLGSILPPTRAISEGELRVDFGPLFDGACMGILGTLSTGSLSAQEIAQNSQLPTVTVYRKLALLEEADLVRCVGTPLTRAGRRVKVYASTVKRFSVRFDEGGAHFSM